MDWMISQKMNAEQMTLFLSQERRSPGRLHRPHGAGRRQFTQSQDLRRPDNIRFLAFAPMP